MTRVLHFFAAAFVLWLVHANCAAGRSATFAKHSDLVQIQVAVGKDVTSHGIDGAPSLALPGRVLALEAPTAASVASLESAPRPHKLYRLFPTGLSPPTRQSA